MKTTINQRIEIISKMLCNNNISELARITTVNQPALRDIIGKKQAKPGYEVLKKILENPTLNIDANWLILGIGEMIKSDVVPEVKFVDNNFLLDRIEKLAVRNNELEKELEKLKHNSKSYEIDQEEEVLKVAEPKNK
jgi:hypothetical protein